jgi:group I intron endonuclease
MEALYLDKNMYVIYKTTNLLNGKIYVGKRKIEYNKNSYLGSGKYFRRAVKKYGKEKFKKEIIEVCHPNVVNNREIFWIKELKATELNIGYNLDKGGTGGNKVVWTEEKRKELSDIIKLNPPLLGKKHSKETIELMSSLKKGVRNPMYGRSLSEEKRRALSERHMGSNNPFFNKSHSKETIAKIIAGNLGRTMSEKNRKALQDRNKKTSKKVNINSKIFESITCASDALGISRATVRRKIKSEKFKEYSFV